MSLDGGGALALRVRVDDPESGTVAEQVFDRSPVRVGRGELNDLQLDRPYVSTWHGLIQFDGEGIRLVDLGSTNGTFVDGARLARNAPTPIAGNQQVSIGRLRLELSTGENLGKPKRNRPVTSFARRIPRPEQAPGASAPNPPNPSSPPAPPRIDAPALLDAVARQVPFALPPGQWPATSDRPLPPTPPAPPASPAPVAAAIAPPQTMQLAAQPAPAPAAMDASVSATTALPPVSLPPAALPGDSSLGDEALALIRSFAEAYLPPAAVPTDAAGVQRFFEVLAEVLETAMRGYLELRSGHEQFGAEMGIRVPKGDGAIGRIGDADRLLGWLLEPAGEESRTQHLAGAFADLMIHQVALLNGVRAGAQKLLTELSPAEVSARMARRGTAGIGIWPLREVALLKAVEARHREFVEEESAVVDVLFGKEFARAYTALTGRRAGADGGAARSHRQKTDETSGP